MGRKKKNQKPAKHAPSVANEPEKSIKDPAIPWLKHALVAGVLILITFAAYSNSFSTGFPLDNRSLILNDSRVHTATGANVDLILNRTYWWPRNESGLYRPFTTFSYLFNYAILGDGVHPAGYHWVNFLLHAINVLLLYLLAFRLLKNLLPAAFIAAVWAVHPVLTESVTNIVGRADLLAGFALLSGLLMYLRSTETGGWRRAGWLAGLMTVTAVGVFSKESAVAILGVIVFYELAFWKERRQVRGLVLGCAAVAVPLLFMLYERFTVMASAKPPVFSFVDNPLTGASFVAGRLTAITVMARYLWLLVWPLKLSCDYSYNQIPIVSGSLHDWLALTSVAAVLIAIVFIFNRSRVAFFFAGLAFISLVPVSNMLFFTGTIMAERFLYVPSIGFAACLVLICFAISRRIAWRGLALAPLCLLIAVFALRTWERNFDWKDDVTLWSAAVRAAPNSYKTHGALAFMLDQADPSGASLDRVLEEVDKSLAIINPLPNSLSPADAYSNAGGNYLSKGDALVKKGLHGETIQTPESLQAYEKALKILLRGADIDKDFNERYQALERKHGMPESEIALAGLPQVHERLALAYLRLGKPQQAYDAAVYARELAPLHLDAYIFLAEALFALNRKEEAAVALMEGLLMSGDKKFLPLLQTVYESGLDPSGCSIRKTGEGALLDNACQPVHNEICKASAGLMNIFAQDKHQDLADAMKQKALVVFQCKPEDLR